VLIASPAVRECLKDSARTAQLKSLMAESRKELGTQTFDQHLDELVEAEQITAETRQAALAICPSGSAAPKVVSYGRRGPGKAASR
jgi:Tfp pilus assembly pilus retraction ATPase PilT